MMIPSSCSPVVPDIDPRPILDMNYAFSHTAACGRGAPAHLHLPIRQKSDARCLSCYCSKMWQVHTIDCRKESRGKVVKGAL